MTATLGTQEKCRNGHVRTATNTYLGTDGFRRCRDCSGKQAAEEIGRASYVSKRFTAEELERLRYLVRCMHCGAVPRETGEVRDVGDGHGGLITLPIVVTIHADGCVGAQRIGRPRKSIKHPPAPEGTPLCEWCKAPMAYLQRPRRWCDSTCRSTARKDRVRREAEGRS